MPEWEEIESEHSLELIPEVKPESESPSQPLSELSTEPSLLPLTASFGMYFSLFALPLADYYLLAFSAHTIKPAAEQGSYARWFHCGQHHDASR